MTSQKPAGGRGGTPSRPPTNPVRLFTYAVNVRRVRLRVDLDAESLDATRLSTTLRNLEIARKGARVAITLPNPPDGALVLTHVTEKEIQALKRAELAPSATVGEGDRLDAWIRLVHPRRFAELTEALARGTPNLVMISAARHAAAAAGRAGPSSHHWQVDALCPGWGRARLTDHALGIPKGGEKLLLRAIRAVSRQMRALRLLAAAGGMPIDALELVDDPASRRAPVEEIARLLCAADAAHGGEPSALSIAIAALRHGATPERAGSLMRAGSRLKGGGSKIHTLDVVREALSQPQVRDWLRRINRRTGDLLRLIEAIDAGKEVGEAISKDEGG